MTMRIPVIVWSDFICPWCYIGEANLLDAIAHLPPGIAVDVHYRPFELNPGTPPGGMSRREYRIGKFGSWERSLELDARVRAAGAAVGLTLDYDKIERTPNTILAHRLTWAAGAHQAGLAGRLFKAYFTDGRDLCDPAVLRAIALEAGLPGATIDAVLDGELGAAEVRTMINEGSRRGIRGVPLFEIGSRALSGAQPSEVLEDALLRTAGTMQAV